MMPVSFLFSALQYSHTPSASLYEALKWKNPSCNISNRDMTNIGGNEVSFLDHSNFWKLFLACWLPIACWLQKCCSKLVHHIGKLFSSMKKTSSWFLFGIYYESESHWSPYDLHQFIHWLITQLVLEMQLHFCQRKRGLVWIDPNSSKKQDGKIRFLLFY